MIRRQGNDHLPPHNLDAERATLGCILLEGRRGMERTLAAGLRPPDFYMESHRVVWGAMETLYDSDRAMDLLTVAEELRRTHRLGDVSGNAGLALLIEQASLAAHLDAYVEIVIEHARRRETIQIALEALTDSYDAEKIPGAVLGTMMTAIERVSQRGLRPDFDIAGPWRTLVESWQRGLVQIGLPALDELTGGIGRGDIVAIAGRWSHGKTALAADRTLALARAGIRVDLIALEETEAVITRRWVANLSGIPIAALRGGGVSPAEFLRAEEAVVEIQSLPLTVQGVSTLRVPDDRTILGAVALSRAEVIVLDHLRKVQYRQVGRSDLQTYAIGRFLDQLHTIAQRDRKVVIVLAQLSRDSERQTRRPHTSDIMDSQSIEQVARQVWLLWWPWKADPQKPREDYEIVVAKNSEGGTGKVELRWDAPTGRFGAAAGSHGPGPDESALGEAPGEATHGSA